MVTTNKAAPKVNITLNSARRNLFGRINLLYWIEHRLSEFREFRRWSKSELFDLRRRRAGRVMKKLFNEAERAFSLPKNALGRALEYPIGHEMALRNYLLDARLTPDNNPAENAICPVVIGRKNFLFVGSPDAGKSDAILCCLAECCWLNRVNFAEYLNDILPLLAVNRNSSELRELLPDRWKK